MSTKKQKDARKPRVAVLAQTDLAGATGGDPGSAKIRSRRPWPTPDGLIYRLGSGPAALGSRVQAPSCGGAR